MKRLSNKQQSGFALPIILMLIGILAMTGYSVLDHTVLTLRNTYSLSYSQMARVASKAAIDYAQEQFDNSSCGGYTGTAEQNLVTNNRYRTTFKVDVLTTSPDGLTKMVRGTGSVYIPKNIASARYVFSVNSEIINTYSTCKTPPDFGPLIWLDGADTATMVGQQAGAVHKVTTFGAANATTRDTIQELASNGSQTMSSWQDTTMQMSTCKNANYSVATCSSNATKYTYNGITFQNVNIPKNATILSATLTLNGVPPAGQGGALNNQLYGLYSSSTVPYLPLWTSSGTSQVGNLITDPTRRTAASVAFSTVSLPIGNSFVFSVAPVVQEMVNNSHWGDSSSNLYNMSFGIQRTSGAGNRNVAKDGLQLDVTYISVGAGNVANGGNIIQWNDKSGNGNNAVYAYGNYPTRQDNQINGKTIARFNNGALLSPLATSLANKRELTTFAVIKPNYTTSASDGRIVSATTTSVGSDLVSGSSIIPLLRYASNNGFSSQYSSNTSAYRLDYNCGAGCNNATGLYTSIFDTQDATHINSYLRFNGVQVGEKDNIAPPGSPYFFSVNQFYFGGTRTGLGAGSGTNYLNGDYAELIVYDHALTCLQAASIEDYLRVKWNLNAVAYNNGCPPPTIPTL